jgi:tetratricopeptide (TPR) repeat protein
MTEVPSGNYEAEESTPEDDEHIRQVGRSLDSDDPAERLTANRQLHRMQRPYDRASALFEAGGHSLDAEKYETARLRYEEYVSLAREHEAKNAVVVGLRTLARIADKVGNLEKSRGFYEDLIPAAEAAGDRSNLAGGFYNLALLELKAGNAEKALGLVEKGLALFRELDDTLWSACAQRVLGKAQAKLGNFDEAVKNAQEALAAFEKLGNSYEVARTHNHIADHLYRAARYAEAVASYSREFYVYRDTGKLDEVPDVIANLASTLSANGDTVAAVRVCGALFEHLSHDPSWGSGRSAGHYQALFDWAKGLTRKWRYHTKWCDGRKMTLEQAVDFAVEAVKK